MNPVFIKSIFVEKYKSLQKSTIDLESGINIIIGKNGAGKSNLLEFINIHVNSRYILINLPEDLGSIYSVNVTEFNNGNIKNYTFKVEKIRTYNLDENLFLYNTKVNFIKENKIAYSYDSVKSNFNDSDKYLFKYLKRIKSIIVKFQIPNTLSFLTSSNSLISDLHNSFLNNSIDNTTFSNKIFYYFQVFLSDEIAKFKELNNEILLKNAFYNLSNTFFSDYGVRENLSKYTPIENIRFSEHIAVYKNGDKVVLENLVIEFFVNGGWLPWSQLSDGTKRLFLLVSEVLSSSNVILIEEPELGIHPNQLFKVLDFLKEQSANKQIIITTHSPVVLDMLSPKELNKINICEYTPQGTRFRKLTPAQKKKAKEYMNEVGELSYYWLHSDLEND